MLKQAFDEIVAVMTDRRPAALGPAALGPAALGLAALGLVLFVAPFLSFFYPRVMGLVLPLAALTALWAAYSTTRRWPAFDGPLAAVLAGVVGLCLVSALWAPDAAFALKRSFRIALSGGMALLFVAAARRLTGEQCRVVFTLLLVGMCAGLIVAAVSFLSDGWPYRLVRAVERPVDALVAANRAMVVLSIFVWPAVLVLWGREARRTAAALPVMLFVLAAASQSQSSVAALVLGSAMVLACLLGPRLVRLAVQYGGAVAFLSAPWLVLQLRAVGPFSSGDWGAASTGARMEIWAAVAQRVVTHPWIGHGLEASRFLSGWKLDHLYYESMTILHPHNGMLQIWLEFGLVGAFLAAGLWILLVRRIAALQGPAQPIGLVLASVTLFVSTVSHGLWQSWWLGTVGVAAALFVLARRGAPTPQAP